MDHSLNKLIKEHEAAANNLAAYNDVFDLIQRIQRKLLIPAVVGSCMQVVFLFLELFGQSWARYPIYFIFAVVITLFFCSLTCARLARHILDREEDTLDRMNKIYYEIKCMEKKNERR